MRKHEVLMLLLILSSSTMLLSHVTFAQPSRSEIPPRFSGETIPQDTIVWETVGSPENLGIRSLVTFVLSYFVVALKVLLFAVILGMVLRCINVSYGGQP